MQLCGRCVSREELRRRCFISLHSDGSDVVRNRRRSVGKLRFVFIIFIYFRPRPLLSGVFDSNRESGEITRCRCVYGKIVWKTSESPRQSRGTDVKNLLTCFRALNVIAVTRHDATLRSGVFYSREIYYRF